MAYTDDDLTRLQSAIAKGARKVRLADEEVEFRSLAEMERIEAKIKRELGQVSKSRMTYPATSSGWR